MYLWISLYWKYWYWVYRGRRFKFWYANYVASSVLLLMIAKEIASFPTLQDEVDEALSKGLIIVAIIDRIIWLFVVNGDEKLPGFPSFFFLFFFEVNVFCDLFLTFFSEQMLLSFFLDYIFIFWHHIFHLLFVTHYCDQRIPTSVTSYGV